MIPHARYDYPPGWFGLRALLVGPQGLTPVGWLRWERTIPWTKVCGVRLGWDHPPQVELAGGALLNLPAQNGSTAELVDLIRRASLEAQQQARGQAVSEADIGALLGLTPAGAIVEDPNSTAAWFGLLFTCLLRLVSTDPAMRSGPLWLGLAVSIGWMIAGWLHLLRSYRVTTTGITARRLGRGWTVPWSSLLDCHWHPSGPFDASVTIELLTRDGRHVLTAPRLRFEHVAKAAADIAAANAARFHLAQAAVPDTALSPALTDDQDCERGISRTSR